MDFSGRVLIIHPTAFHLGLSIVFLGIVAIAIGAVTCFTGALLIPAPVWIAAAVPTLATGTILLGCSMTRT